MYHPFQSELELNKIIFTDKNEQIKIFKKMKKQLN